MKIVSTKDPGRCANCMKMADKVVKMEFAMIALCGGCRKVLMTTLVKYEGFYHE